MPDLRWWTHDGRLKLMASMPVGLGNDADTKLRLHDLMRHTHGGSNCRTCGSPVADQIGARGERVCLLGWEIACHMVVAGVCFGAPSIGFSMTTDQVTQLCDGLTEWLKEGHEDPPKYVDVQLPEEADDAH